jgi:hypothetical protein
LADDSVVTSRKEGQAAFLRPENNPKGQTGPTFEIVLPKTPNSQAGMKMWFSKTIADGINRSRHLPTLRFRKFPNIPPKRF